MLHRTELRLKVKLLILHSNPHVRFRGFSADRHTDQINEIPHVPGQNEASLPGVILAKISRRSSAKNLKGAGSGNSDQIPPGCLCIEVSGIPEEEIDNVVDSHAYSVQYLVSCMQSKHSHQHFMSPHTVFAS